MQEGLKFFLFEGVWERGERVRAACAARHAGRYWGSVTKPILRTPARWAAAMAWATRS
jgi:hypothetical protein